MLKYCCILSLFNLQNREYVNTLHHFNALLIEILLHSSPAESALAELASLWNFKMNLYTLEGSFSSLMVARFVTISFINKSCKF